MRALFAISFSVLILTSQALFQGGIQQGSLFNPEKLNNLERSPIGRAIIHLAELSSKSKGDFDYSVLWAAIDELADGLLESKEEENELFEQDQQQHQIDQQYYSIQINKFGNEVASLKVDLEDLQISRKYYEESLVQKTSELAQAEVMEESLQKTILKNEQVFTKQSTDYDNAINVIDQAIDLLNQVNEEPSFLQRGQNTDVMAQTGAKLEKHLKKLDNTRRIFYQPMVKMFLQMARQGFADQELLHKILSFLNDLRKSLIDNKQALVNSYENERTANQEILNEYEEKIENLSQDIIPQNQEDIVTKNGEISTKNMLLSDATNSLQDAVDSLDSIEERALQRQNSHRNLIEEYDNDLAVINEAKNTLQRGGIVRQ